MTLAMLLDRLDVLNEALSVEDALRLIERRHGPVAEVDEARHRLQRVRGVVLEQLRAVLAPDQETRH